MDLKERLHRLPVVGFAMDVLERDGEDRGGYLAAAVTYYAFLSLFPLVLLALSVVGFVLDDPSARREVTEALSSSIPGLERALGDNIQALVETRAAAGILGVVGLAWTGLGATQAAGYAMSRVFRVPPLESFVKRKGWAIGTTFGLGLLGLGGVLAVAAVGSVSGGVAGVLARFAGPVVALALDLAFFVLAYRLLTRRRGPSLRGLWPGAVVAAVGWGALKIVGTWYVARSVARSSAIYGTFAGAVGVLLLLYLAARLLVLGAELNAVVMERAGHRFDEPS